MPMSKPTDLKLVRIPRNAANALSKHIEKKNRGGVMEINAGRFIGQAIFEKIQNDTKCR
jgi:hypothetical protein